MSENGFGKTFMQSVCVCVFWKVKLCQHFLCITVNFLL